MRHRIALDRNHQAHNLTLTPNWSGQRVEFFFSRSNTQLRPYLKERTITLFLPIPPYLRTEFGGIKFPRLPDVWDLLTEILFHT